MGEKVKKMFASIADDYDRVNSVLSFGIHHYWRKKTVKLSGVKPGDAVLDCATGTGDLAIEFKKKVGQEGEVTGTDFCAPMIEHAPEKAQSEGLNITFEVADVMNLPYENNQFDIASIAFGIRNVDEPVTALREMARVVKPDGTVVILEFGQPKGVMSFPYKWYSRYIMPTVGGLLSGNREAYTYLPETSATFPAGEKFLELMDKSAVFKAREANKFNAGIAYIYVGMVTSTEV